MTKYLLRIILAFIMLLWAAAGLRAQTGVIWHGEHPFDTGYFRPNPDGCEPITNEPTVWQARDVPLAPDGTDLVRIRILRLEYEQLLTCTNVSSEPASYMTSGLYQYRLGHAPGLYAHENHPYIAGHGYDMDAACAAWITGSGAGGGGYFWTVFPGDTDQRTISSVFNTTTVEIRPMSPVWLEANRRGRHTLWTTVTGDYSWAWSWGDGTPPPGWGTHSPLSYSSTPRVRLVGSVEYGSFP